MYLKVLKKKEKVLMQKTKTSKVPKSKNNLKNVTRKSQKLTTTKKKIPKPVLDKDDQHLFIVT